MAKQVLHKNIYIWIKFWFVRKFTLYNHLDNYHNLLISDIRLTSDWHQNDIRLTVQVINSWNSIYHYHSKCLVNAGINSENMHFIFYGTFRNTDAKCEIDTQRILVAVTYYLLFICSNLMLQKNHYFKGG